MISIPQRIDPRLRWNSAQNSALAATKKDRESFHAPTHSQPLILSHRIPASHRWVGIVSTYVHRSFDVFFISLLVKMGAPPHCYRSPNMRELVQPYMLDQTCSPHTHGSGKCARPKKEEEEERNTQITRSQSHDTDKRRTRRCGSFLPESKSDEAPACAHKQKSKWKIMRLFSNQQIALCGG